MPIRIGRFMPPAALLVVATVLVTASHAGAQQPQQTQQKEGMLGGNIKYNSGQSIQPIFEGWTKNADASYQLWFGYLNRNHVQEIAVPVGTDNRIEPGDSDRGQPTYFYTRFNRQLFSVKVPSDFAQKQLIWTVVANGQSERAVGWLRPDWEIAPPGTGTGSGRGGAAAAKNQPPSLTVDGAPRIALADTLTLTATVTDDGLPPPRPGRGRGASNANANRPPAFDNPDFKATTPTNVPPVERPAPPRIDGRLQVSWYVWRGPAGVTFAPAAASADTGKAVFTVAFTKPGDYILRARATDGAATTVQDYKVSVSSTQP